MNKPDVVEFDVVLTAAGTAVGKMRNEVVVTHGGEGSTFEMATDEAAVHGGDNTAPPPLAYFATGLVGCLMTQIRTFSKKLRIPIDDVSVIATCHWRGKMVPGNPYETEPIGFDFDIDIESDASKEDLVRLIGTAKKGCFIEQTLAQSNHLNHRFRFEKEWIDI